jgi:hypothetical protein
LTYRYVLRLKSQRGHPAQKTLPSSTETKLNSNQGLLSPEIARRLPLRRHGGEREEVESKEGTGSPLIAEVAVGSPVKLLKEFS